MFWSRNLSCTVLVVIGNYRGYYCGNYRQFALFTKGKKNFKVLIQFGSRMLIPLNSATFVIPTHWQIIYEYDMVL